MFFYYGVQHCVYGWRVAHWKIDIDGNAAPMYAAFNDKTNEIYMKQQVCVCVVYMVKVIQALDAK